jgi:hypothetical protein
VGKAFKRLAGRFDAVDIGAGNGAPGVVCDVNGKGETGRFRLGEENLPYILLPFFSDFTCFAWC